MIQGARTRATPSSLLHWPFCRAEDGSQRAGIVLLLEAVLALTVLLIGILAMAVLFTRTRDSEARALSETQAALFADGVLNGLRAADAEWAANGEWRRNWDDFRCGGTNIPLTADYMWANYTSLVIQAGVSNSLDFEIRQWRLDENTTYRHHSITYGLIVGMETNNWPDVDRATATLSVWPDRYVKQPFVFYTEFFNTDGS